MFEEFYVRRLEDRADEYQRGAAEETSARS